MKVEDGKMVLGFKELLDLVTHIDYLGDGHQGVEATLLSHPILFDVETDGKTISGKAGLDLEDYQVLYVNNKIVNKQDPDLMEYEQIENMLKTHFNIKDNSVISLKTFGCFTGRLFPVNNSIPVTDASGNPIEEEDDDEEL